MPFVRRLLFKGDNNCEMAQQHSNRSVCSDQYFHLLLLLTGREKNDEDHNHHHYLCCALIQKSVSKKSCPTWPTGGGTCCTDQLLIQSHLYYYFFPHPDDQMPPPLITHTELHWYHRLFPCFSVYIPLMCFASRLTSHPSEVRTSDHQIFPNPTSPHKPDLFIDTRSSWHDTDSRPHVSRWNMGSLGYSFHLRPGMFSRVDGGDR